jgi:hypothetical protein
MHLQGAPTILRAYVCACQCTWQWHIQARPTDNGGRNVGSDSSVIAYNNHKPPTIYCSPSCQMSHIGHSRGQQVFGPPPPPRLQDNPRQHACVDNSECGFCLWEFLCFSFEKQWLCTSLRMAHLQQLCTLLPLCVPNPLHHHHPASRCVNLQSCLVLTSQCALV